MTTSRSFRQVVDLRQTSTSPKTSTPERESTPRAPGSSGARRRRGGDGEKSAKPVAAAPAPAPPAPPRTQPAPAARPQSVAHTPAGDVDASAFAALGLMPELVQAVAHAGYSTPTPIQAQAIPPLLAGKDLLGIAQTGTGKTAAFSLPLLQRLATDHRPRRAKRARALVLTPTRELAIQIDDSLETYGRGLRLKHTVIFGGVGQSPQVRAMSSGVDVLVATPGRLLDLISQGHVALDAIEVFILDEADRMLDMGFIEDVKKLVARIPSERLTLLFSATMPAPIAALSRSLMRDPVRVEVTPAATTVERIFQAVMFVDKNDKNELLADCFADPALSRTLVFTRTKHGADRVTRFLEKIGVPSAAIHGNKAQGARQRALAAFSEGRVRALVATDIAARGIDVDGLTHVINFDLPNEPESYVHRIGRTARAGKDGVALSFCGQDELDYLRDIERLIRKGLPVLVDQPFHAAKVESDFRAGVRGSVKQGNRGGGGGGGGRGGNGGGGGRGRGGNGGGRSAKVGAPTGGGGRGRGRGGRR